MDYFNDFLKSIERIAKLSDYELSILARSLHYKEFNKNELITKEGTVENFVYFIVEGGIRNYVLKDGDDVSLDFFFAGQFANSFTSFLTREGSLVNVEALTETKTLRIHYNDLQPLYQSSLNVNKIGRTITETLYIKRTKRELSLITKTARERYDEIMIEHPELIQNVPQKYLSTFLGISPETLSRLRGQSRTNA